ncbi:hypothetical protein [Arcobacter roscoffensis]|uniref:Methyl-accepting chemotaxis protein n=1 Tax=Arcobacter roscoffensis TaxID=2961520 RepID=A0ABY5E6L0_9BACT|nr:hypothetical protein [Arcobacter roscoffensis]UTJ07801.1 hypothetical protein NJU99_06805 [Arcobacter roscoffensis]
MFSFFKFLQNSIKNLKQNKGLWFTILAVLSITGIFLSLYLLTHMTQNASKEVYTNIASSYDKNLKNKFYEKELEFKKILLSVNSNTTLINEVQTNDLIAVGNSIGSYNKSFKDSGFETLQLSFYPVINQVNQYRNSINSVITSKNKVFGLEVLFDGIYLVYIQPIISEDRIVGVLELKEELHVFKDVYTKEDSIFMFLLESRMLNKLSINARNGKYREVVNDLYVEEARYDGQFFAKIIENGKEEFANMMDLSYSVDDQFYRSVREISDINGNVIGVVLIGQTVANSGSFVNIVDKMTKTVTTVALGLVISILLFMF